ncbi:MAG: pyrroline-5-carboxylate reductase [Bdellovibrionaceae bacterium]|nr:pyrroline-5-carboxylate reductase [Pseudobdellovibrionaceae bacterium]
MTKQFLSQFKVGFIGAGNMSQSIISSLLHSQILPKQNIFLSNRSEKKLKKISEELGVQAVSSNEELVENSHVVVIAVKPQDLNDAIETIASAFNEKQIVISLAAGLPLEKLKKIVPQVKNWVRVMPNTPVSIEKGVIGYCLLNESEATSALVESLFSASGVVEKVDEGEMFEALMVATSSGVGFVYEIMLYWQEWLEEHGFTPEQSRRLTVQTFLGSSLLAEVESHKSLEELQNKVASKKGVTASGLDSMRELEIERAIRYSFEKAVLRDRELAKY